MTQQSGGSIAGEEVDALQDALRALAQRRNWTGPNGPRAELQFKANPADPSDFTVRVRVMQMDAADQFPYGKRYWDPGALLVRMQFDKEGT